MSWDFVTIILFDDKRQAWLVQTVLNRAGDEYVSVGQEIDSDESLVGIALDEAKGRVFNLSEAGLPPRFLKSERERNKGTFLVVPILSAERCFGVVTVESKEDGAYTESDLKTLKQLTDVSSLTFDILSLNDMVQAYIHIDEATGVAGRTFFLERLSEETQRSNDFITDLSLVFVAVDRMDEHINRYGSEGFDFVMRNVGRMIKTSIRQYDILGRYDVNQFAVLLVNTTANEAQIWAEKLRKNIAGNVINIDDKSFSVTVSIGLCPAVDGITDLDLLERTSHVLRKAIEAGGNLVRIY